MKLKNPGSTISRRDLLGYGGALAIGHTMLADISEAATNPARSVEDRGSAIRITKLEATPVNPKVLVKITTNQGIFGWGEISNLNAEVAATMVRSLFELLDGQNPTRIEHIWQRLYRSAERNARDGAYTVHAISAIDMALWDIAGKLYGVPVYRLLGGPTRDRIRVYNTPQARKISPGGPQPFAGTTAEIDAVVNRVKEAREKLGPEGALMMDLHCCIPPPFLFQLAAKIEQYDLMFLEEPVAYGNIEVYKRLKQQIRIPLATGEKDRTIYGVLPYLINNCIDILQPDCAFVGGISQMKKIATLAEPFHVPLAPHCTTTELGMTASFHATASIPHFLIHEGNPPDRRLPGVTHKTWTVDDEGYASLPEGPGLGIEVDEAALAKRAAEPRSKGGRQPGPLDEHDGSVVDY
ncbi:mandelate racemase/muconate lactonizing enzyme family protein [Candidatus Latescibacterota bacterium]